MDLSARISSKLHIAVVTFAAQHGMAVEKVVERALSEYMVDVGDGLLTTPRECRSLTSHFVDRQRQVVELFGVRARGGQIGGRRGRPSKATLAARAANVSSGARQ